MEAWVATLLDEAGGRIDCKRTEAGNPPFLPSLSLGTTGKSRVFYHFVPEGPEMPVFRELLWEAAESMDSDGSGASGPGHAGALRELLLFVSTDCPNCPNAVRTVHALARRLPNLSVHLFEAMQHPELAQRHNVQSVPTLLIDPGLRYVGTLDRERLFSLLETEDSLSLLQEQIRQKILEGSAVEAAEWIAGGGDPSFLASDLGRSTFQERIALLLTLEEALERDPRCLDRMVEPLLPYLDTKDASVRGDIADLLGKIGHEKALPALMKMLQDPDPNVVEAATEAVQAIERECIES
jgi:HEAT repeats/Thioredoxin domain